MGSKPEASACRPTSQARSAQALIAEADSFGTTSWRCLAAALRLAAREGRHAEYSMPALAEPQ